MTEPPKKRKRTVPSDPDDKMEVDSVTKDEQVSLDLEKAKKTAKDVVAKFLDTLDVMESSDPSQAQGLVLEASSSLLTLKALQRQLLDQLKTTTEAVQERRQEQNRQARARASVAYEESHWNQQIQACDDFSTPRLEKMCRDELEDQNSDAQQVMDKFLGASVADPNQSATINTKLHRELHLRGTLERDLNKKKKELLLQQQSLKRKSNFLADLPNKLHAVEKASMPLQRFFQDFRKECDGGSSLHLAGTERRQRLDMARTLPGSLYTLFVNLQTLLDQDKNNEGTFSLEVISTSMVEEGEEDKKEDKAVLMHLPIPEASGNTSRAKVTVQFNYIAELQVVAAKATSSSDEKLDPSLLLRELFPNDTGELAVPNKSVDVDISGKPYHWCNYISGIFVAAAANPPSLESSTRVVVRELIRRIRAHSILTYLLKALERKPHPIPVHSSMTNSFGDVGPARLCRFKETAAVKGKRRFLVTLERKSNKLKASVTLDACRYPSVPPEWSLSTCQEGWGEECGTVSSLTKSTNPLYDDRLNKLERKVNHLELSSMVQSKTEESYDWILAHQLRSILCGWNELLAMDDGSAPMNIKGRERTTAED